MSDEQPSRGGDEAVRPDREIPRCPECGADAGLERTPRARSWRDWRRLSALVIAGVVGVMYVGAGLIASTALSLAEPPPPISRHSRNVARTEMIADGLTRTALGVTAQLGVAEGPLTSFVRRAVELEERFPGRARVRVDYEPRSTDQARFRTFGWPIPWWRWEAHQVEGSLPFSDSWRAGDRWFTYQRVPSGYEHAVFHLEPLLLSVLIAMLGAVLLYCVVRAATIRLNERQARPAALLAAGLACVLVAALNAAPTAGLRPPRRDYNALLTSTTVSTTIPVCELAALLDSERAESQLAERFRRVGSWYFGERQSDHVLYGAVLYPAEVEVQVDSWRAPFWFPVSEVRSETWKDGEARIIAGEARADELALPLPARLCFRLGGRRHELAISWGYVAFAAMMLFLIYGSARSVTDALSRQQDRKRRRAGRCVICGYQIGGACGG